MDAEARRCAVDALEHLRRAIDRGPATTHGELAETVRCVALVRDRMIELARQGEVPPAMRERANAVLSLAYGSENPVAGFHRRRLERTREALEELMDALGWNAPQA